MSNDDTELFEKLAGLVVKDSSDRELAQIAAAASNTAGRYLMPELVPYLTKVRDSL
ncbi:hypothetical protein [Mycolicibacterium mageritense]|uniref:hypothetical protein n=1 Tax=Mycolicibacterium mageritense TaxID=53462 RepID=UPI0023F299C4|nr:hypothetical protein [Mycolicibacterium mageritense]